jgi:DNA (cytosine-5)-methyltransferase 1
LTLKAGALFAGIGGFCEGFKKSGIETSWAIDLDERAENTYNLNHITHEFIRADVKAIENNSILGRQLEPVDVLHAGFPCQSFSMAGERRGFNDPRGQLFFDLMRIIRDFQDKKPAILVFENSPYLQVGERGSWFKTVKSEIQKAGYWFKDSNTFIIDPQKHLGLPQFRPRLFMIALNRSTFRSGRFELDLSQEPKTRPLSDFIDFEGQQDDRYYLDRENRYFAMISEKKRNEPQTLYQLRKFRVRVKDHCPTLTANMGLGGHNVPFLFDGRGLRKLTETECVRLQGFEDFKFPDNIPGSAKYLQIGNSVHVEVAQMIANAVKDKMEVSND